MQVRWVANSKPCYIFSLRLDPIGFLPASELLFRKFLAYSIAQKLALLSVYGFNCCQDIPCDIQQGRLSELCLTLAGFSPARPTAIFHKSKWLFFQRS